MKQTSKQKKKTEKVMHEYKHGELKSGKSGKKVKSRKQAIAIAMSEAGTSKYKKKSKTRKAKPGPKKGSKRKSSSKR